MSPSSQLTAYPVKSSPHFAAQEYPSNGMRSIYNLSPEITQIPPFYQSALEMRSPASDAREDGVRKIEFEAEVTSTVAEVDGSDSVDTHKERRSGNQDYDSDEEIDVGSDDDLKVKDEVLSSSPVPTRGQ